MARTIKKKASTIGNKDRFDKKFANKKLRKHTKQLIINNDDYEELELYTKLRGVDDVWDHFSDNLQAIIYDN
jgi:hypothetical protein